MQESHVKSSILDEDTTVAIPPTWSGVAWSLPLVAGVLALVYWSTLQDMARQWWDDANYSHGFLVPIFSAFLVWQERRQMRQLSPRGSTVGFPVLLAGIVMLLLGDVGAENFLIRSSLIVVLAGLVLFHLGPQVFRAIRFPLAYLLFMVPVPAIIFYAVTFPLQRLAATQAAWVLDLLGVPVLLDGNVIHLSQITLGVTEACSGIRSLISLLAGAVAWAHLMVPGRWRAVVFVASAVPITIIANAARVVATGLIGQWFGVEYASGFFHEMAGLVVYLFAFACLMAVHLLIRLGRSRLSGPVA
jgi:exosortase